MDEHPALGDEIIVPPLELDESDRALEALFARWEAESLSAIEAHARQIVSLCTALLAAFFGLLALPQAPSFLALPGLRFLAGLTLLAFFSALVLALTALQPQRYAVPRADLTAKRHAAQTLLNRKYTALRRATAAFGLATGLMLVTAWAALWATPPTP